MFASTVIVCCLVLAAYSTKLENFKKNDYPDTDPQLPQLTTDSKFIGFQLFIRKFDREYNKTYHNIDEYIVRFEIYKNSLEEVKKLNDKCKCDKWGINELSDFTDRENLIMSGYRNPWESDPELPPLKNDPKFIRFQSFIRDVKRIYHNLPEFVARFEIFKEFMKQVKEDNDKCKCDTYGITKFADRTNKEIKMML